MGFNAILAQPHPNPSALAHSWEQNLYFFLPFWHALSHSVMLFQESKQTRLFFLLSYRCTQCNSGTRTCMPSSICCAPVSEARCRLTFRRTTFICISSQHVLEHSTMPDLSCLAFCPFQTQLLPRRSFILWALPILKHLKLTLNVDSILQTSFGVASQLV